MLLWESHCQTQPSLGKQVQLPLSIIKEWPIFRTQGFQVCHHHGNKNRHYSSYFNEHSCLGGDVNIPGSAVTRKATMSELVCENQETEPGTDGTRADLGSLPKWME